MIWRIRERSAFRRLHNEGRRVRSGALWCTFVLDSQLSPPRVAFALGRAVGTAVARNRVRRQLRHVLADVPLAGGLYLFGLRPADTPPSHGELTCAVGAMMVRCPMMVQAASSRER